MNNTISCPSSSILIPPSGPLVVDENAPNAMRSPSSMKSKPKVLGLGSSGSFTSPTKSKQIASRNVPPSNPKTPSRSPLCTYSTRSSSKKARVASTSVPSLPLRTSLSTSPVNMTDSVRVVSGSYFGRIGTVVGVSDRTYKLMVDGKVTGNIPKGSVVRIEGGEVKGSDGQMKLTDMVGFDLGDVDSVSISNGPTPKKRRRGTGDVEEEIGLVIEEEEDEDVVTSDTKAYATPGKKRTADEVGIEGDIEELNLGEIDGERERENVEPNEGGRSGKAKLKSCFKSPTKVFTAKGVDGDSMFGVSVWKGNGLNPKVKKRMEVWKKRYRKVADEGTEEEGEGEGGSEDKTKTALVKAGVETGGGWGTWPKEEDIFDGTFSNIVPGDAGGREDDAVLVERNERGELPEGLQHGEGWKCLLCLNVNDLGLVKCGCCERRRLR